MSASRAVRERNAFFTDAIAAASKPHGGVKFIRGWREIAEHRSEGPVAARKQRVHCARKRANR